MGAAYSFEKIPDLAGKTYLVTGANTGIGYVTAREIARRGGKVYFACRSIDKMRVSMEKLRNECGGTAALEPVELDLASLASVQKAADALVAAGVEIDCLINNAGVMACPFGLTVDGFELQFGTNHLGHFALTLLLAPLLRGEKRVVCVSSVAHMWAHSSGVALPEQLRGATAGSGYAPWVAYGHSKLCNILFARALAAARKDLKVFSLHPGYVATELQRHASDLYGMLGGAVSAAMSATLAKSPDNGALTTLFAATSAEALGAPSGTYFVPTAKVGQPNSNALDDAQGARLLDMSFEMVKDALGDATKQQMMRNFEGN